MKHLSEELKRKIKERVEMLETRTSVEFVPHFVGASSSYISFRMAMALFSSLGAHILLDFYGDFYGFGYPQAWDPWLALAAGLLVWVLLAIRPILKVLLPRSLKRSKVARSARLAFLEGEVFATKNRTGVLIYVSELEQSVFVLADKGFSGQVADEVWVRIGGELGEGFNSDHPAETVIAALDRVAGELSSAFPPRGDNPNELSDHLRS